MFMVKHNSKEAMPKMSNMEASLRAKLLMKSAQLEELSNEYDKLKEDFNHIKKLFEKQDNIEQDMKLELSYCAGKLSAYQEVVKAMLD